MIGISIAGVQRTLVDWLLRTPFYGEWRAEVRVESDAANVTARGDAIVILDAIGNEWCGTVRAVSTLGAYDSIEVLPGAGGLDVATVERFYGAGLDARDVLRDLCGDAGEASDESAVMPLPQWRTRGQWLRDELDTLATWTTGVWRSLPDGRISLTPTDSDALAPGDILDANRTFRVYESPDLPPLIGTALDGWRIGHAVYQAGRGRPTVTVYEDTNHTRPRRFGTVGATVEAVNGSHVDVTTDRGIGMTGIPLWSVVGYVPTVRAGARVILVDLGDDPRSTVAFAGASDSEASGIVLAQGESETLPGLPPLIQGRVVRYGDMVVFPVGPTATPTAMPVQASFPPGTPVAVSRVKG